MSDLYAYNPHVCDGDACHKDCEHCGKREEAEEQTPDDEVTIDLKHGIAIEIDDSLISHVEYTLEQCGYTK